jgi:hypothetical protein
VTRAFTFPGATGLGQSGLHDLLELELLNRANALAQAGPLNSWGTRPPHLAAILL